MLHSGDAYGRSWERNQGKDIETFRSAPEAVKDRWGGVTIDLFHWLLTRLEFDERMENR